MDGTLNASSAGTHGQEPVGHLCLQGRLTGPRADAGHRQGPPEHRRQRDAVNTITGSSTTFTRFDGIAFTAGTPGSCKIYSDLAVPVFERRSFGVTEGRGAPDHELVKLAGNGAADPRRAWCLAPRPATRTRRRTASATSAGRSTTTRQRRRWRHGAGGQEAVVQFVRGAGTIRRGRWKGSRRRVRLERRAHYSTYVAFHDVSGTWTGSTCGTRRGRRSTRGTRRRASTSSGRRGGTRANDALSVRGERHRGRCTGSSTTRRRRVR